MGDDFTKKGSSDSDKINLDEDWERRYWVRFFGTTEMELREAVAVVSSQADALRKHFWLPRS